MTFMLLTPVNTKDDPDRVKAKILVNLNNVHDISPSKEEEGTVIDFGGDEPVWVVAESVEEIVAKLNAAKILING
jgi:hypothetical protein